MIDYPGEDFPVSIEEAVGETPAGRRVVILTITNQDDRRPATLGPIGLARFGDTLDELTQRLDGVAAVIITGNSRTFCAGANLDTLSSPRHFGDALQLAQEGHRVLGKLSTLGVPTIAAINGTALGGGLELALHCTYRVSVDSTIVLGLPELGLGVIPGWGGTTLLPKLIGLENALTVMVDNSIAGRNVNPSAAKKLGIVDALVPDAVRGAMEFVDGLADRQQRESIPIPADAGAIIDAAIDRYTVRPGNPIDALTHLRRTLHHALSATTLESFEAEDAALADLMTTAEFRRRLYAFRVTSAATKVPAGTPTDAPREINRVGVVGAGLMASQIAMVFAEQLAVPVVISDVSQERLDAATSRMNESLGIRVSRGNLTDADRIAILKRIQPTLELSDFAKCDLIMEAVFEDLAVKKDVLTTLEKIVQPTAILASNTSSLSIDSMAEFVGNPSRVAGIHFFNPVGAMKLVEIVRGSHESAETLATAIDVARKLRKTPVLVADQAGFVVNRILSTFLRETLRLVESGVAPRDISEALLPMRLPMNPFALIDLIGRMVTLKMLQSLENSAPDRFFVGESLVDLTEQPRSESIAADLDDRMTSSRHLENVEIHDTIVGALAREVRIMLDAGVVGHVSDIDVCMINGAGWPTAIGGITPYLDGSGTSERVTGELFHPSMQFA